MMAGMLGLPLAGEAEEAAPAGGMSERLDAIEKKLEALDVQIGGLAYGSYQYNFNEPDSRLNSLRSLDQEHNSFTLDLFQLQLGKKGPGGVSFASKLDFGKTARRIISDWDGSGTFGDNGEETNDFELQEAYIGYAPDWAGGASLKFGKFVTLLGSEVIEATSNPNFSRSFMFGFAIPFSHTGLLFTVPASDIISVSAGVVNGWDNVVDNNDGKTFLGSVSVTPSSNLAFYANGTYGPEQTNTSSNPRGIIDLVSTFTFDPVSGSLNFDYGSEGNAALNGGSEKWYGFSGIVGLDLKSVAEIPAGVYLRGEVFKDDGGGRTGADQTLHEITLTGKYFLTEKLVAWVEYRHDGSDADSFAKKGTVVVPPVDPASPPTTAPRFQDTQDTVTVALSYVFSL
jgi:hypothetical protein